MGYFFGFLCPVERWERGVISAIHFIKLPNCSAELLLRITDTVKTFCHVSSDSKGHSMPRRDSIIKAWGGIFVTGTDKMA